VRAALLAAAVACSPGSGAGAVVAEDGVTTERVDFAGASFDVVRVDVGAAGVRIVARDAAGALLERFAKVRAAVGPQLVVAMNAGIFEPGLAPTGLLVSDGVELGALNTRAGEGNFYLAPNGVFALDEAGAWIVPTDVLAASRPAPRQATQSGPMLVIRAIHPAFRADSMSVTVRNGVGIVSSDRIVLAISRDPVNLETFARLFRDRLGCRDALYLDGAISGMWAPALGREDAERGPFAAFVVVEAQ
jgi:uncharacterized protein YigE (DUF2233 family)